MPVLFGIILGVILTVAGTFLYDSSTGRAPNGLSPSTASNPPMVNWDVVSDDWQVFKTDMHDLGMNLERGVKRLTG